jgi:hypothetical protein
VGELRQGPITKTHPLWRNWIGSWSLASGRIVFHKLLLRNFQGKFLIIIPWFGSVANIKNYLIYSSSLRQVGSITLISSKEWAKYGGNHVKPKLLWTKFSKN